MMRIAALALAALAANPSAAHAEPRVSIVPLGFEAGEVRGPASRVAATIGSTEAFRSVRPPLAGPLVVVWGKGGGAVVQVEGGEIRTRPFTKGLGDLGPLERGRGTIPGARIGAQEGLTVTLEDPTRDYPHEALGSAVHARSLVVAERRATPPGGDPKPVPTERSRIEAGPGAVFEDLEPRLVDLDGDGVPEIVLVRSTRDKGSSLVVVGKRGGAWRVVAETPPDGEPFRWLNVAAAGDLGPGLPHAIAIVRRPHLDGLLQVWRLDGDRLVLAGEAPGYANHAYGSTALDLAGIVVGQDGTRRLALPTLDRKALAFVALGPEGLRETARIALPARALTGVAVLGRGSEAHILVGLEDGRLADIRP